MDLLRHPDIWHICGYPDMLAKYPVGIMMLVKLHPNIRIYTEYPDVFKHSSCAPFPFSNQGGISFQSVVLGNQQHINSILKHVSGTVVKNMQLFLLNTLTQVIYSNVIMFIMRYIEIIEFEAFSDEKPQKKKPVLPFKTLKECI